MNNRDDWQRTVETAIEDAGIGGCVVEAKVDGENKVVIEVTQDGRTADGPPGLVLEAISDAVENKVSLTEAFDVRNMFAPAI